MIKRNIKMVVTPKQSKQVQEICFANGIGWWNNCKELEYVDAPYLIIKDRLYFKNRSQTSEYKEYCLEEVDVAFFIKTKGSCIEENQEQDYKAKQGKEFIQYLETQPEQPNETKPKQYLCYVQGKSLPKHIHKTLEQAKQEAQRLCKKELAKVSVLEVVAEFEAEVLVKEVL